MLNAGGLGPDRAQLLQVGAFAVGVLDWTAANPGASRPFVTPTFTVVDAGAAGGGSGAGAPAFDAAEYASRRIVGIVFVVLSFLTLVFYGLWVASGVVAEKSSRVMELLISAATAPQLVTGKILGIGLAGLAQVPIVLAPAVIALLASGRIGDAILGPDSGTGASLSALSPGLLGAFIVYFVLGFGLYAALYAGAGSLLSREEDLQTVALPLSIPAVAGYFPAVLALSGSTSPLIRFASYVPLWSPFVMMSRLAVGHVEPWELALSVGLLAATVPLVTLLAIRVYRAGVVHVRAAALAADVLAGRSGASRGAGSALVPVERQAAQDREHGRRIHRVSALVGGHASPRPTPELRWTATGGSGRPAGMGSSCVGRACRRSPGRPPPHGAPAPPR